MEEKAIETVEKEQTPLDKLTELYFVYQKNVRNISAEDLEGKYKKAFEQLKEKLCEAVDYFIYHWVLDWLHYEDDDAGKKALDDSLEIIRSRKDSVRREVLAMEELNLIVASAQNIRCEVIVEAWWPYQMGLAA